MTSKHFKHRIFFVECQKYFLLYSNKTTILKHFYNFEKLVQDPVINVRLAMTDLIPQLFGIMQAKNNPQNLN